jgi:hypothetical protein
MATKATKIETIEYRVIVAHRDSASVLAMNLTEGYHLPRVPMSVWARPARQLRTAFSSRWGLDVFMLDFLPAPGGSSSFIVAELRTKTPSPDLESVSLQKIPVTQLPEEERARVRQLLDGVISEPFSRLGWLDEALQWAEAVTHQTFSSKAEIDQYNAGGAFTLVRLRADDGALYWLKATGEPNIHECSVTCLLSKLCGGYLPEVVASKPEWNAWLMSGEATDLSALQGQPGELFGSLEDAAEALAELQMKTMGHEIDLLQAGAFDQRMGILLGNSAALFKYLEEAMSLQTSTKAPRMDHYQLVQLRETFERACTFISELGIPDTIVHGDMNLGNILQGRNHCQFIDWSEAYIGHPLVNLQHLLLLNQKDDPEAKAASDRILKERYRSCLSKVCDPLQIDRGFACMPLIAAASALFGRGDWFGSSLRHDPRRQAHARTLARHMDRAAKEPELVEALRH